MDRSTERLAMAHKVSVQRSIRLEEFPHEMFDEHAWSMLLIAYQRQAFGLDYTVADVVTLAGASTENGARWLKWLHQDDLMELADGASPDGPIRLTGDAIARMDRYLDRALEVFGPNLDVAER